MRDRIDEIRARGAELVIVGNGAPHFAAAFREDYQLDCPLLVDPELRAYRAAGLRRGRVEALSPAELAYRYVSGEAGDHPPVDDVLAALADDAARVEEDATVPPAQLWLGRALSRVVDPFIVSSFDRTGFRIHSLTFQPDDLDVELSGRRCIVTGANSGIGYETALALADLGAEVVLVCRSRDRGEEAVKRIREQTGNARVSLELLDVSDLGAVREAATRLASGPERVETADGLELTFATHVVGPFLLTALLRASLEKSPEGRVIWVSSGGMYTRRLNLEDPNWTR
ncbi:MAG: SDR family NAD(P)-dependent oxidoreductase, partial [Planctomycetota bacterium]